MIIICWEKSVSLSNLFDALYASCTLKGISFFRLGEFFYDFVDNIFFAFDLGFLSSILILRFFFVFVLVVLFFIVSLVTWMFYARFFAFCCCCCLDSTLFYCNIRFFHMSFVPEILFCRILYSVGESCLWGSCFSS